jgi:hypothetical protein
MKVDIARNSKIPLLYHYKENYIIKILIPALNDWPLTVTEERPCYKEYLLKIQGSPPNKAPQKGLQPERASQKPRGLP